MEKFEIVIVGGGPAGLRAAEILASKGKKVVVLEKKSMIGPKICAGGLTFNDFELGIPLSLVERIFPLIKVHFLEETIDIESKGKSSFLVATINRQKLGQWMAEQAEKKGARIWTNSEVEKIEENCVILKNGKAIEFDYLIGADGSLSVVRKFLNLSTKNMLVTFQYVLPENFDNLEIFLDKNLFNHGYAWIFPHKTQTFIGAGIDFRFQEVKKIKESLQTILQKRKIDISKAEIETYPINYDYQGFDFGNKFLVGDAAGFAPGFIGKGIDCAIISGQEIAKKILDSNYNCPKIEKLLKYKTLLEKLGKPSLFKVLRSKTLTQIAIKKFCNLKI